MMINLMRISSLMHFLIECCCLGCLCKYSGTNRVLFVQTKETLTLKASSFGSKCELSTKFMDNVGKIGVSESVLALANFKQTNQLKKTDGAKRSRVTGMESSLST